MAGKSAKKDTTLENQQRENAAIVHLKRLLQAAKHPDFRGSVSITVPAKGGVLGDVKAEQSNFYSQV